MKYAKLDLGKIEAIVNKLGGYEGIQDFLSGETIVIQKEDFNPFTNVFRSIVTIREDIESKFKKAGIDLTPEIVCNNKELPYFGGHAVCDASGSSLDIEFKNKQDLPLVIHLFNRKAFGLSMGEQTASTYPLKRLADKDFLEGLKAFYNKKDYKNDEEIRRSAFKFIDKFRN